MPEPTFVKICGITRLVDARAAIRAGANALGFVFAKSPRHIAPAKARRIASHVHPALRKIGVFVNSPVEKILQVVEESGLDGVQLQGDEGPDFIEELKTRDAGLFVAKVVRVSSRDSIAAIPKLEADALFLDRKDPSDLSMPSKPIPVSWLAQVPATRVVVAGGLNPGNVGRVVREVRPWGVDVSSGVEIAPGVKDPIKMRSFVGAVRRAERTL